MGRASRPIESKFYIVCVSGERGLIGTQRCEAVQTKIFHFLHEFDQIFKIFLFLMGSSLSFVVFCGKKIA